MIKISIKKLEKELNLKLKKNIEVLGLDLATRTGWCLLKSDDKDIYLDYSFLDMKTLDRDKRYYFMTEFFKSLIKPNYYIVIEDTFMRLNAAGFKFLSRLGGIIYAICYFNKVKHTPVWIYASSARKKVGIKGNTKKIDVAIFLDRIGIKIEDEDICDAIVLSLTGCIKEEVECIL